MAEKLYLCDGKACNDIPDYHFNYCYLYNGGCCQTSNPEHSLSKQCGDKFPPTLFVRWHDTDIYTEKINMPEFMKSLSEGKTYIFPEGFIS